MAEVFSQEELDILLGKIKDKSPKVWAEVKNLSTALPASSETVEPIFKNTKNTRKKPVNTEAAKPTKPAKPEKTTTVKINKLKDEAKVKTKIKTIPKLTKGTWAALGALTVGTLGTGYLATRGTKAEETFKKVAGDSSVLSDALAGIEPTGVYTFRNASKNKEDHARHKAVGDLGGFLGGAVLSTVISAGGTAALGKVISRKYPTLGAALVTGAKDSMSTLNPKKLVNTLKKLPESSRLTLGMSNMTGKAVKNTATLSDIEKTKNMFIDSKKYYDKHKTTAGNDFASGVTMLGTLAAGALGGALNATSAHTQYNAALDIKTKLKNKRS